MRVKSLEDYFFKSGDTKLYTENIEHDNEKGFCSWEIKDKSLVLLQVYGDGMYWNDWATKKAEEEHLQEIIFGTLIDPCIFKKYGFTVTGHIMARKI